MASSQHAKKVKINETSPEYWTTPDDGDDPVLVPSGWFKHRIVTTLIKDTILPTHEGACGCGLDRGPPIRAYVSRCERNENRQLYGRYAALRRAAPRVEPVDPPVSDQNTERKYIFLPREHLASLIGVHRGAMAPRSGRDIENVGRRGKRGLPLAWNNMFASAANPASWV